MVSIFPGRPGDTSEVTPLVGTSSTRWAWSRRALAAGVACVGLVSAGSLAVFIRANADLNLSEASHIWFMHIPKTSTKFMLEVVFAMCPDLTRPDLTKGDCLYHPDSCVFRDEEFKETCYPKFAHMEFGHSPPDPEAYASDASFVAMFREPASRMASGFVHAFHDCPGMTKKYGCSEKSFDMCPAVADVTDEKVREYFDCVKGCQARMVLGRGCPNDGHGPADGHKVEKLIEERYSYVGITERFEQSLKDFHRLMGATAELPSEAFAVTNPQRGGDLGEDIEGKVVAALQRLGLTDWEDEATYAAALKKNDELHAL